MKLDPSWSYFLHNFLLSCASVVSFSFVRLTVRRRARSNFVMVYSLAGSLHSSLFFVVVSSQFVLRDQTILLFLFYVFFYVWSIFTEPLVDFCLYLLFDTFYGTSFRMLQFYCYHLGPCSRFGALGRVFVWCRLLNCYLLWWLNQGTWIRSLA